MTMMMPQTPMMGGGGMGGGQPQVDMWERIAGARATQKGNYLKDGRYVLCAKEHRYEQRYSGLTWITEAIVVHAEAIPGMTEIGGEACSPETPSAIQVVPNAVGTKVSFAWTVDNPNQPNAAGNVKSYLLALSNTPEDQLDAAEAQAKQRRMMAMAQIEQFKAQNNMAAAEALYKRCTMPPLDVIAMANRLRTEQKTAEAEELLSTYSPFMLSAALVCGPAQGMRGALIKCNTRRDKNKGRFNKANEGKILVLPTWQHVQNVPAEMAARRQLVEQGLPVTWTPPAPAAG